MRPYIMRGSGNMRGDGIGRIFSSLMKRIIPTMRAAVPYLKSAGASIGKSLLKSTAGLTKDVISRKRNVGEAFKERAGEVAEDLSKKLEEKVKKMTGGRKRKRTKRLTPRRKRVSSNSGVRRTRRRRRTVLPNITGAGKKRRRRTTKKRRQRRSKKDLFSSYSAPSY